MKYCLRTNRKTISAGSTSDRDRQFRYLCRQRNQFEKRGDPVLSVDAKKRELIGNLKTPAPNGSEPLPPSTIMTSVPPPKVSPFRMASTILRPTVDRFSWELPTKHLPSPSPVSANGGCGKVASATRNPATFSSWPTLAAAMAHSVAPETRDSTSTVRWSGPVRHSFALPFRSLQMESHRAPFVQPDQQELGG